MATMGTPAQKHPSKRLQSRPRSGLVCPVMPATMQMRNTEWAGAKMSLRVRAAVEVLVSEGGGVSVIGVQRPCWLMAFIAMRIAYRLVIELVSVSSLLSWSVRMRVSASVNQLSGGTLCSPQRWRTSPAES